MEDGTVVSINSIESYMPSSYVSQISQHESVFVPESDAIVPLYMFMYQL